MAAKTEQTKGKKVTCDICNKQFVEGYIGTHKRRQHGVAGGQSGIVRNGNKSTFTDFKRVKDMILLEDSKGQMWIAERIK
jgi:hypothetical protein